MGGPPGYYGQSFGNTMKSTMEGFEPPGTAVEQLWYDDANMFEIYFDDQGQVVGFHKRFGFKVLPPEGTFAKLRQSVRRHLGL